MTLNWDELKERIKLQKYDIFSSIRKKKSAIIGKLMEDEEELKKYPRHFDLTQKLGEGGFGAVYKIDNKYALKILKRKSFSHPSMWIVECAILASIHHPNLVSTSNIIFDESNVHLLQELAIIDLEKLTRKTTGKGQVLSIETLYQYSKDILKAIAYLHDQGIVHADIKASNLLLFSNHTIKLGDFSISVISHIKKKFTHRIGTPTHKPPEIWLEKEWDSKIDIWSLGCTFYEIAYGESLFPKQGIIKMPQKNKEKKKQEKRNNRQRHLNCLVDFMKHGPMPQNSTVDNIEKNVSTKEFSSYKIFRLSPYFYDQKYSEWNQMLLRCLKINPNERPNIHTLTDDATAVPLELPALIYIDQPDLIVQHFSDSTKRLYRLYFSKLKIRDEIFSYASYLYNRYSMTLIEKNQKFLHLPANILLGCLCIALKILQHENLEIDPLLQNLNDSDDLIIHIADTLHCKLL